MGDLQVIFLTLHELHLLTGCRIGCRQIEWLRRNRVAHFVNAAGCPVVTRIAVEGRRAASQSPTPVLDLSRIR